MKRKDISRLKRRVETIEQEGYLQNCWIGQYRPRGTARGDNIYFQLRSKEPLPHGKRSKHLTPDELDHYQQLVRNGRELRKLRKEIAYLEKLTRSPRATICASASDEWYTPPEYIGLAWQVMGGIDCDPASNEVAQKWVQAETWYGIKENGLTQPWHGRVWLNPPYGTGIQQWTGKAITAYEQGDIIQAILLVRPAPGSAWFQELAGKFASCVTNKRIKFIDAQGQQQASPVHGNVFFYLGEDVERFRAVFSGIGVVARPW